MAKILSKILNKLPLYDRCGGCVYNLRLGAILSFILLFGYTCLIFYEINVLWKTYLFFSKPLMIVQLMAMVTSAISAGLFVFFALLFFLFDFGKNMLVAQLLTLVGILMAISHAIFDLLVILRSKIYRPGYAFSFFMCTFEGTKNDIEFAYLVRDNKDEYHFLTLYMDFLMVHFIIAIYSYARYLNEEDEEVEVTVDEEVPSTSREWKRE